MGNNLTKKELAKKIENFLERRDEIIFAYIFGSFIEKKTFNDIDIAIYVNESSILTKNIFYTIEISNQLEELIKIPVDIILLNKASDFVLHRVSKGMLVKNSNENIRTDFITEHWKIYWDFKNKIHEHTEEMKAWK